MAWKYRIKEVRLKTGETRYYPQFRASWFPFWCCYRDYEDNKLHFEWFYDAKEWIDKSKAEDEPEVECVVKHHYL